MHMGAKIKGPVLAGVARRPAVWRVTWVRRVVSEEEYYEGGGGVRSGAQYGKGISFVEKSGSTYTSTWQFWFSVTYM